MQHIKTHAASSSLPKRPAGIHKEAQRANEQLRTSWHDVDAPEVSLPLPETPSEPASRSSASIWFQANDLSGVEANDRLIIWFNAIVVERRGHSANCRQPRGNGGASSRSIKEELPSSRFFGVVERKIGILSDCFRWDTGAFCHSSANRCGWEDHMSTAFQSCAPRLP